MQTMLLSAGLGSRLLPLTLDRAKPAVPFLGKPLILGLVEMLQKQGLHRVVVNTHHRPESIQAALHGPIQAGQVALSHETTLLGTAGGIRQALDRGLLDPEAPLLVLNAKLNTAFSVEKLLEAHRSSGAKATMLLRNNPERAHFREVQVNDGRVVGFGEGRVPQGPDPLLFTGIHVMSPEVLATIPPGVSDSIQHIYPPFIEAGEVHAHLDDAGHWQEFSTLERYLQLHQAAWANGGPRCSLSEGAHIDPGALAEDLVLWEGARVERDAEAKASVLGAGVRIEAGQRIISKAVVRASLFSGPLPDGVTRIGANLCFPIRPEIYTVSAVGPRTTRTP